MLESGNPSIFTSDVSIPVCAVCCRFPRALHSGVCLFSDHLRLPDHQAGPERDRVPPQGHHEAGVQHQGAARDVHGHGHVRGDSGEPAMHTLWLGISSLSLQCAEQLVVFRFGMILGCDWNIWKLITEVLDFFVDRLTISMSLCFQ